MTKSDSPGPRSRRLRDRDIACHLHGYTNLDTFRADGPLIMTRGQGVRVFDQDGKAYIEGMAGLWCTALGFDEERLVLAMERQARRLPFYHSFSGRVADVVVELAEKLLAIAPVPMSKVLFCGSGSEANDTAVKLVWYYNNALGRPAKKKIITRERAYHGVTIATASMTGLPINHRDFDLPLSGFLHTTCPHHYRHGHPGESAEEFSRRCADDLEALILREGPDTVAAFFAEPVMGAGGVIVPPRGYFEAIQEVLRRYDVLLVADEVICGFGRTGSLWGSQTFGLRPDMLVTAKGLSSGYLPISALLVSEAIHQAMIQESARIGIFGHGFTYGGHPVAAAVAREAIAIYEERDILGHVGRVGPLLQDGLRRFSDHPLVGEVRGVGLVAGVELVRDKASRAPFEPARGVGPYLARRAQESGLIIRAMGDTIAFAPPLILSPEEVAEMLELLGRALDETWAWLQTR